MKNILFLLSTSEFSGAEKVAKDIITHLNNKKYRIVVVCTGQPLSQMFSELGFKSYVINKYEGIKMISTIKKIEAIIKAEKISLIHSIDVNASLLGYLAGKKHKVPTVSHIQNCYDWLKSWNHKKVIDKIFRSKYAYSIACSDMTKEHYQTYNKSLDYSITSVPNSIDFKEIPKHFSKVIPNKGVNLLFVGRLVSQKRIDIMLQAFRIVVKKRNDAKLYLVGEGEEKPMLIKLRSELNLTNHVFFLGRKKNIYDYLNQADIFVLSSDYEGLPLVILEAMVMKKVIVATKAGGVPEIITHQKEGLLCDKGKPEKLAKTILDAINNIEKYKIKLGRNAYRKVIKNYSMNNYIQKIEDIYDKVWNQNEKE